MAEEYACCCSDELRASSSSAAAAVQSAAATTPSHHQALASSTSSDSMWDGWTVQPSPLSPCALTEQLQQQQQQLGLAGYSNGGGGGVITSSSKNSVASSSDQHDVLSSWLLSAHHQGFQGGGGGGGGGTGGEVFTGMYQNDFSRINMLCSSADYHHGGVAPAEMGSGAGMGAWGSSDAGSQQLLYEHVMQACSLSAQTGADSSGGPPPTEEEVGDHQSCQVLLSPAPRSEEEVGDHQSCQFLLTNAPRSEEEEHDLDATAAAAVHRLDVSNHGGRTMVQLDMSHPGSSRELSSMAASSSCSEPPLSAGLMSYVQTSFDGSQFDSGDYWTSNGGSVAGLQSSSPQLSSACSGDGGWGGGGMRSSSTGLLQRDDQQPNTTSCDSIMLHQQHQHQQEQEQHGRKNGCEGEDVLFHNSGTDLAQADHMYTTELHGLFGKIMDTPRLGGDRGTDHHHHHQQQQQLGVCGTVDSAAAAESYGDPLNWTQFTISPRFSGEGFIGIQEDRTMVESSTTADCPSSTAPHVTTRREESSPPSAGTAISTIHNFNNSAAATATAGGSVAATDLTHAGGALPPYRSSSAKLDSSSEMGQLQRKRPPSRGSEQVEDNGVTALAEDSVKRSRVVRCLWEQNIAQLQLANLPSEHHRNLWQSQSQAFFGRLPSNFLVGGGGSSLGNCGSMDMNTAVGPALNTNGRPRARRGSATDPQSVYARHRRERINDRLKVLQHLVPNGAKVDIVTMLEEAINYVKFLQLQVRLLSSDELWIYAPTTYNGVDVSMGMHAGLLNQKA